MTQRTTTISCRVDAKDAEFLLSLEVPGASTVSEKFRHVLADYRQRQQNLQNFRDCLMDLRNFIAPVYQEIQDMEHSHGEHSEFVNRLVETLPSLFATLLTSRRPARKEEETKHLHRLEKQLIDQVFQLIESLLRMAVSSPPPCYSPDAFTQRLRALLSLTEILAKESPHTQTPEQQIP